MKSSAGHYEKKIMLGMLLGTGLMALYIFLAPASTQAVGVGGLASTLNAATTAAVAGYGASTAATAADDDD